MCRTQYLFVFGMMGGMCFVSIFIAVTKKMYYGAFAFVAMMVTYLMQVIVFWNQAPAVWDADDSKAVGENGGFVKFVINVVFYFFIVQQSCCVLATLCLCCVIICGGDFGNVTGKFGLQRNDDFNKV